MTGVEYSWYQTDSEQNYVPVIAGVPNYTKTEILYKFNSDGYRCDEFNLNSEYPILFMGCSFTEGVGLPYNEIWSYYLHKKLSEITNKKIPYWSLAKGGTSIDYGARCLYNFYDRLKPKYIFYLLSGISRREYCFENSMYSNWFPHRTHIYQPSKSFLLMEKIFVDPYFALYQAERSAMILNSLAEKNNTKIFLFGLNLDLDLSGEKRKELFKKFTNIHYSEVFFDSNKLNLEKIPADIKSRPSKARDNSHPSAFWQFQMYENIYNIIINKIEF